MNMKKSFLVLFLAIFLINCNGAINIHGIYEANSEYTWIEEDGTHMGIPIIEFDGKIFNLTYYPIYSENITVNYLMQLEIIKQWDNNIGNLFFTEEIDRDSYILIKETKKNRENIKYYKNELKGKYSLHDNKIEFLFEDGSINVLDFSRTENAITIGNEWGNIIFVKKTINN